MSENLTIWQEESLDFETVDGKVVANCRVFERVDLFDLNGLMPKEKQKTFP